MLLRSCQALCLSDYSGPQFCARCMHHQDPHPSGSAGPQACSRSTPRRDPRLLGSAGSPHLEAHTTEALLGPSPAWIPNSRAVTDALTTRIPAPWPLWTPAPSRKPRSAMNPASSETEPHHKGIPTSRAGHQLSMTQLHPRACRDPRPLGGARVHIYRLSR
jgi:hypothetical protein